MVSQSAPLVAVQGQPVGPVTSTWPEPASLVAVPEAGLRLKVQPPPPAVPSCVTVKLCPAMVSVPVRGVLVVFGATEYVTVPPPLPLPPDAMVRKSRLLLVACQAQPVEVVTVT